jgi:hypothetical protein
MKLFRVLLIFAFMLAAMAASPAQAAGGKKIGFIRLLASVDAKSPLQVQARSAFNRIRPQLLALQKQGVILAFEPELKAGIVKIEYAVSGLNNATALLQYQTFDNIHDAIVPGASAASHGAQPEALAPIFDMELYDSCFSGTLLGADSHVFGSLSDKAGRIIASYEGYADSSGDISFDCFPWSGSYTDVLPGYKVTFKIYDSATPTLLGTFSIVAPDVDFTFINKTTAVVSGTGPAGKPYAVSWYHDNLDAGDTWKSNTKYGTISATGTWFKDMSGGTFRGYDALDVYVKANSNFWFLRWMDVPYIYCQLGGNYCEISGFAFQPATISIVHAGTTYSFSGKFAADGYFFAKLENAGDPIFLKAGDKVSGTKLPSYTLPALTGTIYFSTDVIAGKVPANRYFDLWAYSPCSCTEYLVYSHSSATGSYNSDFSSQVDLVKMEATNIEIYFTDPATGNVTDYFRSFVP